MHRLAGKSACDIVRVADIPARHLALLLSPRPYPPYQIVSVRNSNKKLDLSRQFLHGTKKKGGKGIPGLGRGRCAPINAGEAVKIKPQSRIQGPKTIEGLMQATLYGLFLVRAHTWDHKRQIQITNQPR